VAKTSIDPPHLSPFELLELYADIEIVTSTILRFNDPMVPVTLSDLPNEILQQILLYVPPAAAARVQQVCHRFNALVEPLVWKHYYQTRYRYWDPDHQIRKKYMSDVGSVNWKKIFTRRYEMDTIITQTLNSILESQTGRIDKFQGIIQYGYDAKDCLLRHIRCSDDAEDVLARR
jgi:F-box protein 21